MEDRVMPNNSQGKMQKVGRAGLVSGGGSGRAGGGGKEQAMEGVAGGGDGVARGVVREWGGIVRGVGGGGVSGGGVGVLVCCALLVLENPSRIVNRSVASSVRKPLQQQSTIKKSRNITGKKCHVKHNQLGFVNPYHPMNKVYRLKKALYGLKQAPRAWYDELSNFLVSEGFSKGSIDSTLSCQSPRGIFINQAKYAQEILKKHGMTSCDSIGTPMATKYLDANLSGTPIDQMKYRSMVGELMYLTASRPDIIHATCYCARIRKDTGFGLTAFLESDHEGRLHFMSISWKSSNVSLSECCAQVLLS
ncbi:retrovirus-related pol polyprotein from transposon TNT 1-94 [Tanacetum coccineum]